MRSLFRWMFRVVLALVLLGMVATVYALFVSGRPPAARPDLVRLPENAPPAPAGYPTRNAAYLAVLLGWQKVLDPAFDWPVPAGVIEEKDVEYGRVGQRPLTLDLYYPENLAEPVPGLIFIHGGGWEMGDKRDYKYYTVRYAKRGFVAATIGYRFSNEAGFPGCVEDAKCAVRWMRANAKTLLVDPERIAVIGGSAGGHLSMMVGYSSDVPELEGTGGHEGVSSAVAAVVDLYGPSDATVPGLRDVPVARRFLKNPYDEAPERYRLASPIFHLDAGDPPTLVIQGTTDDIVPVSQSDMLVEKMQELGLPHWYARIDGWPHTLDVAPEVNDYVQWLMNAFFNEYLKSKPAGSAPLEPSAPTAAAG